MAPASVESRVSVVIPAYNSAATIGRAVRSAAYQTPPPYEVIVVDDGSADDSASIALSSSRLVRLIRQRNAGASAARNAGLAAATGNFVAFLDSDDEWLPGKLDFQLRLMGADPSLVLSATGALFQDECGRTIKRSTYSGYGSLLGRLLCGNVVVTSSVLLRRSALERAGGAFAPGLTYAEDWDLWLRMARAGSIAISSNPYVRYSISSSAKYSPEVALKALHHIDEGLARPLGDLRALTVAERRLCRSTMMYAVSTFCFRHHRRREGLTWALRAYGMRPLSLRPVARLALSILGR